MCLYLENKTERIWGNLCLLFSYEIFNESGSVLQAVNMIFNQVVDCWICKNVLCCLGVDWPTVRGLPSAARREAPTDSQTHWSGVQAG